MTRALSSTSAKQASVALATVRRAALIALAAVLTGAAFLALTPAPAHAEGWKQSVVTVSSTAPDAWGVGLAVRQWNAGRVDGQPRLVLVDDKAADVRVRMVSRPHQQWSGFAQPRLGYVDISLNRASFKPYHWIDGSLVTVKRWTTSHEFGHALGLPHNNVGRSVMSYSHSWTRTAGLPDAYDFRQLSRLYR